jgi:uncharacterized phage protein (TIGR01671 family)
MTQREIKFRAWQKNYKEMYQPHDGWIEFHHGELSLVGFNDGDLQLTPKDCILMQYTGLKDKNGKEIYEGDVVKVLETAHSENDLQKQLRGTNADYDICEYVGVVTWDDEGCDYSLIQQGQTIEDAVGFPRHMYEHEVIGNIYENPELLK